MSDRELLELAAKAAKHIIRIDDDDDLYIRVGKKPFRWEYWNPRDDDGDALRLAVKLELPIEFWDGMVIVGDGVVIVGVADEIAEECGNDPYAATRRAIVRAAAEIGRNMK